MARSSLLLVLFAALAMAACHHSMAPTAFPDGGSPDASVGPVDVLFPSPDGGPGVPLLPTLDSVVGTVDDDRVSVKFAPVAGAKDYRIFPLPDASDVRVDGSGKVTVVNATYRCAGDRFAPVAVKDGDTGQTNGWTTTWVNRAVEGFQRIEPNSSILGYVFLKGGSGRVPVYALGDPQPSADNQCGGQIWEANRVKRYTTSESDRRSRLAMGWRDEGIPFYAPAAGDLKVEMVGLEKATLYFSAPDEVAARAGNSPTDAFTVLSAATAETISLMRVHYHGGCSYSHDELMAGQGWYERDVTQGNRPLFEVQWSGLTKETTLVVEALDSGCPFQGHLAARSLAKAGNAPDFVTIANVRAGSATGEVYLNGQHEPANVPAAIARSFIKVSPLPRPAMDFLATFPDETASTPDGGIGLGLHEVSRGSHGYVDVNLTSSVYDAQFYKLEPTVYSIGAVGGELWVAYADWGSDNGARFRLTPKQTATMADSLFVHATMLVDLWSTGRRYPQLIISDQLSPVQENFQRGTTILAQARGAWPFTLELQLCDHRTWDVNNQCPRFHINPTPFQTDLLPPVPLLGEITSPQQLKQIDLYVSTSKAYLFVDGKQGGCANLTAAPHAGPVSVTFGDVLYHSGVDEPVVTVPTSYPYLFKYQLTATRRHFDNAGFSSGVAAPPWDASALPCTSQLDP